MACLMAKFSASGRLVLVGSSVCSGEPWPIYWNRFSFFGAVLWRTVRIGPGFSGEPSIRPHGSLENRPIPGHIGPSPAEFDLPAGPQCARSWSPTGRILDRDKAGPSPERNESFAPESSRWPPKTSPWSLLPRLLRPKVDGRGPIRRPSGPEMSPRRTPVAVGRALRARPVFNRNGRSSTHSSEAARPGGKGNDRDTVAQSERGRVECRSIAATSAGSS